MSLKTTISYELRITICALIAVVINLLAFNWIKKDLSRENYTVSLELSSDSPGFIDLYFDAGNGFSENNKIRNHLGKGAQKIDFQIDLKNGEFLKKLRIDFEEISDSQKVTLSNVSLRTEDRSLYSLSDRRLRANIALLHNLVSPKTSNVYYELKGHDPYLVLKTNNELMMPIGLQILLLTSPFILLLAGPIFQWFKHLRQERNYLMLFCALFVLSLLLKISWVTFTTLLLLAYGLFSFNKINFKKRRANTISLLILFLIPLVLLGDGDYQKLSIPLGFIFFMLIGQLIDFKGSTDGIRLIFVNIFSVFMVIIIVNWILLIFSYGVFYDIYWDNYFFQIKESVHHVLYWIRYDHTTFLSFFLIVGAIFCWDLHNKRLISSRRFLFYLVLSILTLIILGSRYALAVIVLLPVVLSFLKKNYSWRILLPITLVSLISISLIIPNIDPVRKQQWEISVLAASKKPLMGYGTGNSEKIMADLDIANESGLDVTLPYNHPHNQYLTYLLENGIIGLLIFLTVFITLMLLYYQHREISMTAVCFIILVLMFTESPFKTATALYGIVFLLAIHPVYVGSRNAER